MVLPIVTVVLTTLFRDVFSPQYTINNETDTQRRKTELNKGGDDSVGVFSKNSAECG